MTVKLSEKLEDIAKQMNLYRRAFYGGPNKSAVVENILQAYAKNATSTDCTTRYYQPLANAKYNSAVSLEKTFIDKLALQEFEWAGKRLSPPQ